MMPPKTFCAHAKKCCKKTTNCSKCLWYTRGPALRKLACLPGTSTTWLACAVFAKKQRQGNQMKLGCVVCHRLVQKSVAKDLEISSHDRRAFASFSILPTARFFWERRSIRLHMQSKTHIRACQLWSDESNGASTQFVGPVVEQWELALRNLRKGHSMRDREGTSDQKTLVRWCLTESVLGCCRAALRTCKTLILIRDERQGKLMIRFRATLQDMTVLSGLLGVEELSKGKKAQDLLEATKEAIKIFSTINFQPPRGFRGRTRNHLDQKLAETIQEKCQMVVTDCASVELLAQEMSRGRRPASLDPNEAIIFPNAKIIGRDRAHACQRLLSRPWKADSAINGLLQALFETFIV